MCFFFLHFSDQWVGLKRHLKRQKFSVFFYSCRMYCCSPLQKIQQLSWSLESTDALWALRPYVWSTIQTAIMLISFSVPQNFLHLSYCLHLLDCIIHDILGLLSREVNDLLLKNSLFQATISLLVLETCVPSKRLTFWINKERYLPLGSVPYSFRLGKAL